MVRGLYGGAGILPASPLPAGFVFAPALGGGMKSLREAECRPHVIFAALAFVGVLGAQTCTFTLTTSPQSFPIAGGDGIITIVASANSCIRPVASSVSWVTISFGQTGTGNG